jgi:hypothetical protein
VVTTTQILNELGMAEKDFLRGHQMRIDSILRSLGWVKERRQLKGETKNYTSQ